MRAASVHRPPHLENLEVNVTAYERSMAAATRMHGSQRMSASVDQTPVTFRAGLSPYRATPLLVPREDMGTEHYGPTGQARRGQENTPRSATTTTTTTTTIVNYRAVLGNFPAGKFCKIPRDMESLAFPPVSSISREDIDFSFPPKLTRAPVASTVGVSVVYCLSSSFEGLSSINHSL